MNERLIMIGLSISLIFGQFQPDVAYTSVVKVRVTRFYVKYHTGLQWIKTKSWKSMVKKWLYVGNSEVFYQSIFLENFSSFQKSNG